MTTNRKELILQAATKSFALFGYKATTMDQVAKLANVGKGTIYTFFKNKEELFNEIVQTLIFETRHVAEESMDPSLPFYENFHRALFRILELRKEHQLTIKLLQEEKDIGTPIVQEAIQKLENAIVTFMGKIIEEAVKKGEIKTCDPEITAFVMLRLYVALISDWEKTHAPLPKEEVAKLFQLYVMKGLLK